MIQSTEEALVNRLNSDVRILNDAGARMILTRLVKTRKDFEATRTG